MDWVEQTDRFWAGELGVAAHVLRTDGFHRVNVSSRNSKCSVIQATGGAVWLWRSPASNFTRQWTTGSRCSFLAAERGRQTAATHA